jgi:hypothetical protein
LGFLELVVNREWIELIWVDYLGIRVYGVRENFRKLKISDFKV